MSYIFKKILVILFLCLTQLLCCAEILDDNDPCALYLEIREISFLVHVNADKDEMRSNFNLAQSALKQIIFEREAKIALRECARLQLAKILLKRAELNLEPSMKDVYQQQAGQHLIWLAQNSRSKDILVQAHKIAEAL